MSYICYPNQTIAYLEAEKRKQENVCTYSIEPIVN